MDVVKELQNIIPATNIREQEPMSRYTTFGVGGPARVLVMPETVEQAVQVLTFCKKKGYLFCVLGRGSNLLVSDKGYDGVAIYLPGRLNHFQIVGNRVIADAGASLGQVAMECAKVGLQGMAFAAGIPGSIGGGVCMNCGAYGGDMSQVLVGVWAWEPESGELIYRKKDELALGYRDSRFLHTGEVVLRAEFLLPDSEEMSNQEIKSNRNGCREEELQRIAELQKKRMESQPLEYRSAGSTFKRPQGAFAGKLIMDCGLAGYTVGDAQVSEKHCGFVINRGAATATDIYTLCEQVQKRVLEQTGYTLELEIRLLGNFEK